MGSFLRKTRRFFKILGPGVITGAADDDPSGIATYSQAGAQFGYGQLWTAVAMFPFMTAIQEAVARIGAVTGKGLAHVIKEHYSRKVLFVAVFLIVIANTINIGADIGALGAALQLVMPWFSFPVLVLFFTALILFLEIFITYRTYAKFLKWLALALLAYPITVLFVAQPWGTLLRATFVPNIEINFAFLFIITGVLGTTISPYMFFWQASEEVEEERAKKMIHHGEPAVTGRFMKLLRLDNFVGMAFSEVATWSMIVVAATVLHAGGITNIGTAADAARALEPLVHTFPNAGFWAKMIFSTGIIGLGLLGIPVLSASASYALSEAMSWKEGLNLKFKKAHGFYGVITVATLIGLVINFIGIDPIRALVIAAVINGVVAVPLILLIGLIAGNKKIMGEWKSGWVSKILVYATFAMMGVASVAMFYQLLK